MHKIGDRQVPDPLITMNSKRIHTAEEWQRLRRPETIKLFEEHVYGEPPIQRPDSLKFNTISIEKDLMDGKATRKKIDISYEGPGGKHSFRLHLYIPNHVKKPAPTFLLLNNRSTNMFDPETETNAEFWPAADMINRGYAAAQFHVSEISPDDPDNPYENSVLRIFDEYENDRPPHIWGTIAAWAWGASRAMDYLEQDPDIDANLVAVIGHSRGGKTALWAATTDKRFAFAISNNSGNTGAAISRKKNGETIEQINTKFPHWFNGNYKKYNGKEHELPLDQHMLIASIAPRPVYVASASNDAWADPKSEFLSLEYAEPVYRLFGFDGLGTNIFPENDAPIYGSGMGYHVRTGDHNLTKYDWKNYMDFWEIARAPKNHT